MANKMNKRMGIRNCGTCKYDTKTLWELCGHPDSGRLEFWAEDRTPGQCDHWQPHEAPRLGGSDRPDDAES